MSYKFMRLFPGTAAASKDGYTFRRLTTDIATEGLSYTLSDNGKYYICSGIGTASGNVIIADTYKGKLVTEIEKSAFSNCTKLTGVTIPDSVTSIGERAFNGCSNLSKITIPNSVESIGPWAFCDCTSLTSITIPNSVTKIGTHAFEGCGNLSSMTLPYVGTSANATSASADTLFGAIFGTSYYDGGTETRQYYSSDSGAYKTYYIPTSLISVTITGGNILYGAFSYCDRLTSVTIPDSATSIGIYAFRDCTGLTSVTIGNSVTSIGNYAFDNCTSLTSVTIPNSVESIGGYAFHNCTSLTSITVDENNQTYKSVDGNVYSKDGKTLIQYAKGKTDTRFAIPNSVTSIGNYAFYGCSRLTSVIIPDSIESIGGYAFYGCSGIIGVTIPANVTSIGREAFHSCTSLTSIAFNDTGTWYRVSNESDWQNKTGGTQTSVTNTSTNATNFKNTYYQNYWYKL